MKSKPVSLAPLWEAYQKADYATAFQLALDGLLKGKAIDLLHIMGLSLCNMRRTEEGMAMLKAAVFTQPKALHIYSNSALMAEQAGRLEDVGLFTEMGLQFYPFDENLLTLKANNYMIMMKFDEAIEIYKDILTRKPDHVQCYINLGSIYRNHDKFDLAEEMFAKATELDPHRSDLIYAKATMHSQRGEEDIAIQLLENIGNEADARTLLAMMYLAKGEIKKGFHYYESRHQANLLRAYRDDFVASKMKPFDHYAKAEGKTIGVIQEGGIGDAIMFSRYFRPLAEIAHKVIYYVPKALVRLLQHNYPMVDMRHLHDSTPCDFVIPDFSLPYVFHTDVDSIPLADRFTAPPDIRHDVASWKLKVGLCWAGGTREDLNQRSYDIRRSIPIQQLTCLQHPDVDFFSLQQPPHTGFPLHMIQADWDLADTAALIEQLDLVITVDTAIAHLAASMQKPTWLLSRLDCDWRWMRNQPASPWYPTMRIFGQTEYKNWGPTIQEVRDELYDYVDHQPLRADSTIVDHRAELAESISK